MDRLKNAAVLTHLVQKLRDKDSWAGETHIQKAAYLLQTMLEVPLGFQFVLYMFGPFSFELRDELTALRGDNLLCLQPQTPPYGPRYEAPKERADYIQGLYPVTLNKHAKKVDFIASQLGAKGVAALERLATAFYVKNKLPGEPFEKQIAELVRLKPHITQEEAVIAFDDIAKMTEAAQAIMN